MGPRRCPVSQPALRPRTALLAGCTALLTLLATGSASAASYEQIDRATGPNGQSSFVSDVEPYAVSDTGRFAIYATSTYNPAKAELGDWAYGLYLRDILTDQTRTLTTDPRFSMIGMDAAETNIAMVRRDLAGEQTLMILPLAGGPARPVATIPADEDINSSTFSGDGTTIAIAGYEGPTRLVDVATGAITTVSEEGLALNGSSLSDDGTVLAGGYPGNGFMVKGGVKTSLPDTAIVSPDGSTVSYVVDQGPYSPRYLAALDVATGEEKRLEIPESLIFQHLLWISPDGGRVLIGSGSRADSNLIYEVDLETGDWSGRAAPNARGLNGERIADRNANKLVSRNGKFAVLRHTPPSYEGPRHLALVSLAGTDLPGSQQPLSASSYFGLSRPARLCTPAAPGTLEIGFGQPARWIAKPLFGWATVTFSPGGQSVTKTFAKAQSFAQNAALTKVTIPATATSMTVKAGALDRAGKYVESTERIVIGCTLS